MAKNKFEIDMINGTIMNKMISFAIPLMLSGILQLLFNAVDIIVVGRFSGSQSLAAVGSTSSLINMLTNLFIGIYLSDRTDFSDHRSHFFFNWRNRRCRSHHIHHPS